MGEASGSFQSSPGLIPNRAGGEQEAASSPGRTESAPLHAQLCWETPQAPQPSPVLFPARWSAYLARPGEWDTARPRCCWPTAPCTSPCHTHRSPCPSLWSCVGRHVSGPGQLQLSTPVPESLWAGMRTGARGGSKEGRQTLPPPWAAGPKGFSGVSLLSVPCPGTPCPSSGGDERRAAGQCELLLPPAGIALLQCQLPRSRPGPRNLPLRSIVAPHGYCSRSPGLVRGLFLRVGTSCLPGPAVSPTDPVHDTTRTSTERDTFIAWPSKRVTLRGSPETRVALRGSPETSVALRGPQPGGSPGGEGTCRALQAVRAALPSSQACAGAVRVVWCCPCPAARWGGSVHGRGCPRGVAEGPNPGRGRCAPTARRWTPMPGGGEWGCRSSADRETQHSWHLWRAATAPGGSAGQGRRRTRG